MNKLTALFVLLMFIFTTSGLIFLPQEAQAYINRSEIRNRQKLKIASNNKKNTAVLGVKTQPQKPPSQPPQITYEQKKQFIMNAINGFRASKGLASVQPDANTCNFAKKRALEITTSYNHNGFANLPYLSYSLVAENIAQTGNYQDVASIWINSPPHAENMSKDTPFGCVEFNGNFYVYEGWKP